MGSEKKQTSRLMLAPDCCVGGLKIASGEEERGKQLWPAGLGVPLTYHAKTHLCALLLKIYDTKALPFSTRLGTWTRSGSESRDKAMTARETRPSVFVLMF